VLLLSKKVLTSAGSFALPEALGKVLDIKDEKGYAGLEDIPEVLEAEGKGLIKGAVVGAAGNISKRLTNKINSNIGRNTADYALGVPIESTALIGTNAVLEGHPITVDDALTTAGTIGVLKGAHFRPFAKRDIPLKDVETRQQNKK
jgi:hypothetical protein